MGVTSREMLAVIEEVLAAIDESSYLVKTLDQWVAAAGSIFDQADLTIDVTSTPAHQQNEVVRAEVQKAIAVLKQTDLANLYAAIFHIERELREVHSVVIDSESIWLNGYLARLQNFRTVYQSFVTNYQLSAAVRLLRAAGMLRDWIASGRVHLRLVRDNLQSNVVVGRSGESRLSLFFESDLQLVEMAEKLIALQSMYSALCAYLGVSEQVYPLRAAKIESGTFWMDLFGHDGVVALMTGVVLGVIQYIYRTVTPEGKLGQIPKNFEIVAALLESAKHVEAAGGDARVIRENAERVAVKLSADAVKLVGGEPVITINGERHSVTTALEKRLLEARGPKLIEHR
jgi:uncharacterized protein YqgV (UPF0045/DUF77 family)